MGAVIDIGAPLDGRQFGSGRGDSGGASPMRQLADAMQARLDLLLHQGPRPEWGCPPAIENAAPAPLPSLEGRNPLS
jgi:hypothetical protein